MKTKSFVLLLNVVLLTAMVLSACAGTATPAATTAAATEAATQAPATAVATDTATQAATVAATQAATAVASGDAQLPDIITWPDKIADGRPVTITVVQKPADSNAKAVAAWEDQVKRFQTKYPNVTIQGTDYSYAPDSFAALVAGNQVPTLFEVYLTDPSSMIDQGIATDLTSYIKDQNLDKVFNSSILDIAEKDGKYYGIPRFAYAMGLAYNIKLLKAAGYDNPPTTWDELATMAQKLTDRNNGVAGLSFITDGSAAAGWHLTTIAYNFGLKNDQIVTKSSDGKYTQNFATGPVLDTLNFIHDLRWKYNVLPLENLAWDTNGAALANGTAAMVVMAGDQFTWLRQTYPDAPINDFGFAPLPAGGSDGKSVSLVGGNIAMVSSKATSDQVEAAVYWRLFTQFDPKEIISNYESSKSDSTVVVGAPELPLYVGDYEADTEAVEAKYANLPIANYKSFMDAVSSGKVGLQAEPLVSGQDFYTAMGTELSTVVTDQNANVATSLQQAATTFQTNVLDQLK